jgi:hybrid cluster-associated redox disulfide protein
MKKITKETTLKEILEIEGAEEVLQKYNLPCLFCPMASFEISNLKIGDVCKVYGINEKDLLKDLNSLISKEK